MLTKISLSMLSKTQFKDRLRQTHWKLWRKWYYLISSMCTNRTRTINYQKQFYFIGELADEKHVHLSYPVFLSKGTWKNLTLHIALTLIDFSKSHLFTIQDEAQGYLWNSVTVHSTVVHFMHSTGEKVISTRCNNLIIPDIILLCFEKF